MKLLLIGTASFLLIVMCGLTAYGFAGWSDAKKDAPGMIVIAEDLERQGLGVSSLREDQLQKLLLVQDPSFYTHNGVDNVTAGAGVTTLTQSLSKRLAFEEFKPGIAKIRQTGYAMSLEHRLSKDQIITLFLHEVHVGRIDGDWVIGLNKASLALYDRPLRQLEDSQFDLLIARLIAPSMFSKASNTSELHERARRIAALWGRSLQAF